MRRKLSQFVNDNKGAGKMFRADSRVDVWADNEKRSLIVEFKLLYRVVSQRAEIRMKKVRETSKSADVAVSDGK